LEVSPRAEHSTSVQAATHSTERFASEQKEKLRLKFGLKQAAVFGQYRKDILASQYVREKFRPVHRKNESITPVKIGLNSKVHVNLSKLIE